MTRIKEVYPTGEIAHLWAHQTQEHARNPQRNFYFDGPTLYSYGSHHVVAQLFEKEQICLFNIDEVSNTTSQHHSNARRALESNWNTFYVPYPDASRPYAHIKNAERLLRVILCCESKAAAPRRQHLHKLQDRISSLNRTKELQDYCTIFKIKSKVRGELATKVKQPRADINALLDTYEAEYTPLKEEYDAKLATRRNLADAARHKKWEEQRLARERTAKENEAKWRSGGLSSHCMGTIDGAYILRVVANGKTIETSGGARVGKIAAKLVWRAVLKCRETGQAYTVPPNKPIRVDHYSLNSVDARGNVQIGCHHIKYNEMLRLAKQLDWVQETV